MKKHVLLNFLIFLIAIGLTTPLFPQDRLDFHRKVEVMPEFPGGEDVLDEFIRKNINYPGEGIANKKEGTVYVTFIVETDGTITQIKALKGIGETFEVEAERVVKKMPKWKPGQNEGEKVRVLLSLPIEFKLNR